MLFRGRPLCAEQVGILPKPVNQKKIVFDALLQAIIAGDILPQEPLRQEDIATKYNVSRMPVREVFKDLEAVGLLQIVPNSGAFIAPLTLEEFRENYEMRAAAECLAIRKSIPELNNRQLSEARHLAKRMASCASREYSSLNNLFHSRLYEPCRMPRLLAHIQTLGIIAERYIRLTIGSFDYTNRSNVEHLILLDACDGRDSEAAERILETHIVGAGKYLEQKFF
jgi:DNA-binding GntR family transcriptional regulator